MEARELFEDLGYKTHEDDIAIVYEKDICTIAFTHSDKELVVQPTELSICFTMLELKAIVAQCRELGWFEQKEESNLEHYLDDIIKLEPNDFRFALENGEIKDCEDIDYCGDCAFNNQNQRCNKTILEWLKDPYKKPRYVLTKFEYDLLRTNDMANGKKLKDFATYLNLKKVGYFKDIDFDLSIVDVLSHCKAIKEC